MSPCMQNEQNLTSVIDKTNRYLRYMKLATIRGRISSGGASKSMLSRTYARCTLFLLRPELFFPTGFLLPGKVFNETTNKRVQHHIIHWWTSKGECCKYYNICGCLCKYSLVMSLRYKSYSYIREPNENEMDNSSSSYILFFSFLSISFLVYNKKNCR